jgi:hypothetical protein
MVKVSNAVAVAQCNAAVDLIDAGSGAGYIEFRTGSGPADCDTASNGTLLATLTFSTTAFGPAGDASPGALATAAAITGDTSADATGIAGYARVFDSDATCIMQLTVSGTGGGGEITVTSSDTNANITSGLPVDMTSFTFTQPES